MSETVQTKSLLPSPSLLCKPLNLFNYMIGCCHLQHKLSLNFHPIFLSLVMSFFSSHPHDFHPHVLHCIIFSRSSFLVFFLYTHIFLYLSFLYLSQRSLILFCCCCCSNFYFPFSAGITMLFLRLLFLRFND